MIDRTSILSFLAGGVTGAALALLTAPQSGIDTRQLIGRKVRATAGLRPGPDGVPGPGRRGHRRRRGLCHLAV
jgi:hypothetical protein